MEKLRRNEFLMIVFDFRVIVLIFVMRKGVGISLKLGVIGCKVIIG